MRDRMTTPRKASAATAGVLQELELHQPVVVTGPMLEQIIEASGSSLGKKMAAERLVREGWLSPLRTRDSWEFIPASRAGSYPSGDPWIELRALIAHDPQAPVAVAFASAVWEHGFSSHPPSRHTFAHRQGWRPPRSLGDARSVRYDWRLPEGRIRGLPVWAPATIVVAAAHRPSAQDNWANADDWLPESMRAAARQDIVAEAMDRGVATLARLGYMAEWSHRSDVADAIRPLVPDDLPVTYLGPRERKGRWISDWRLYDSLLPSR